MDGGGGNHVRMTPNDGTTMASTSKMVAHNTNDNFVASAAADLIRQLDAAFAEMNSCIVADVRDAEEAHKNARVASELARRFASGNFLTHLNTEPWSEENSVFAKPQKAPSRPAPMYNQNGATTAAPIFSSPRRTPAAGSTDPPSSSAHSSSKRLNRTAERWAVAHAEDLLQVSLELERTKHSLESEQMSHDESKSALHQAKQKNAQLEAQIENLLQDMETAREESGRKVDALEDDLRRAVDRIQTAEYDATMATDICIQADEQREEKERLLQRALEEINLLKEHIASSHSAEDLQSYLHDHGPGFGMEEEKSEDGRHRHVRFEDEVVAPSEAATHKVMTAARPSRALVAAGRHLLYRNLSTDGEAFVSHHSAEASTARRHRLNNRLQTLDVDLDFDLELPKDDRRRRNMGSAVEALDVCRNAAKILKESGQRLSLTGRWFNGQTSTVTDEIHLETLAKHYTTLVEVQLDRKNKDVLELESLISLWEEGISMKRGASTDIEQDLNQ